MTGKSWPIKWSSPPGRFTSRESRRSRRSLHQKSSNCTARATADRAKCQKGGVLVVGGGNSGFQIAKELSASHAVELAVGSRQTPLPQRVLGRDLFWWLTKLGVLTKTVDSRIGRRARDRDTLIGSSPRELKRRHGVTLRPRAVRASGRTVTFADGTETGVQRRDLGHRVSTRPLVDPHPRCFIPMAACATAVA